SRGIAVGGAEFGEQRAGFEARRLDVNRCVGGGDRRRLPALAPRGGPLAADVVALATGDHQDAEEERPGRRLRHDMTLTREVWTRGRNAHVGHGAYCVAMDHADEHVLDRAIGAVLGTAVGDVMGAPYEFGSAPFGPDGAQL